MASRSVVVLGAGPAGLAVAVALARAGHEVTVVERDHGEPPGSDPFEWERRGVPHYAQPHMLIPRACKELREGFPDVYAALLSAGASEIDLRPRLQGIEAAPGDDDLRYLAVRRPLLEAALRTAAQAEPGVQCRFDTEVDGLLVEDGTVHGVSAGGTTIAADVVVDAMGRRSQVAGWLAASGFPTAAPVSSPCAVVYYSRYFQVREGKALPEGPWLLGPRGDLGFMGYGTFPGDNGTFAVLLTIPTGVPRLKAFRDEAVFDAAVAKIPLLARWVDPELVEPLTPVLAMAGLSNTLSSVDEAAAVGLFRVGDAQSHTDPTLAHGIAFLLVQARAMVTALAEHDDLASALAGFSAVTASALRERFELATALGSQRHRGWTGGGVDLAHRNGDYALFSVAAAGAAAMVDPEVLRVVVRRLGLLDSTRVLDDDEAMQERIELVFGRLLAQPRPAGPTRDELVGGAAVEPIS